MTVELFMTILIISATATSAVIELIKILLGKFNILYKSVLLAVITAFIVGCLEVVIYYFMHNMEFTIITILYSVCMGIANALSSTCGYDLVKKAIFALVGKSA